MIRHGDVQLIAVSELPEGAKQIQNRGWLFEGEVTGHAHRIDTSVSDLFETKDGKLYLRVNKLSAVDHEEHKTTTLQPGLYFVAQKRQYNAGSGWEPVAD